MEIFKEPEVIAAIIGVVGALITALFSVSKVSKEIYSKNVIEQRTLWIRTFREKLSVFMSAWEAKRISKNNSKIQDFDREKYNELMIKGEEARYYLLSTLNTKTFENNEYNQYLKDCLLEMKLIEKIDSKELLEDSYTEDFMECANRMLHQVWVRAKEEAGRNA